MDGHEETRLIYRRLDESAAAAETVSDTLRRAPGVKVLDVKPRTILVEVDASKMRPKFDGWGDFEVRHYAVPDIRPKLRK